MKHINSMTIGTVFILGIGMLPMAFASEDSGKHHNMHEHHEKESVKRHAVMPIRGLTEAGNDVFGTIQEVIQKLEADPATDWSKVNIEKLRQHLLDMYHFTINVEVVSQEPISGGVKIVVRPTIPAATASLNRALSAHPKMIKKETGWDVKFIKTDQTYVITTTTSNADEINKLRGLGNIGIMAYGKHHQPHHWAMATGQHPHH